MNKIWSSPLGTICSIPKTKYSIVVLKAEDRVCWDMSDDLSAGCK